MITEVLDGPSSTVRVGSERLHLELGDRMPLEIEEDYRRFTQPDAA